MKRYKNTDHFYFQDCKISIRKLYVITIHLNKISNLQYTRLDL